MEPESVVSEGVDSERADSEGMKSERAFGAPWEAQVFALVLTLQRRGLFTWTEWSQTLASVVSPADEPADEPSDNCSDLSIETSEQVAELQEKADSHFGHWLAALEKMVVSKGVGGAEELSSLYQRWEKAARGTPHGQPIELDN